MGSDGHRAGSELFVCFPSRTSMSLMPKPILSPGRSGDGAKRVRNYNAGRGQSSPMFSIPTNARSSKKKNSEYDVEEPTSPKVTCAGQVRVKPTKQCKSWQSVMAEIEKLHEHKHRKRGSISSPGRQHKVMGLKKEVVQFVTALRNLRVDFGCFGAPAVSTDDDDEEDDEEEEEEECKEPTTVFAKWFMMLQDNEDRKVDKFEPSRSQEEAYQKSAPVQASDGGGDSNEEPVVPPPNALLLMRCRSAPSRASLNTCMKDEDGNSNKKAESKGKGKAELEKKSPAAVLRRCDPDFSAMLSMDVSKETWVNRRDFMNQSFMRSVSLKG